MSYNKFANVITAAPITSGSPKGFITMAANASATTITVQGTFYKAAGTTTLVTGTNFTMPSNNRLTYTGTDTITVKIDVHTSGFTTPNPDYDISFIIYKDGVALSNKMTAVSVGGSLSNACSFSYITTAATNNYFEVYLTNEGSTAAVTLTHMQFIITQI